jgi:NADPH:quinone reductase-like Zn-dependent oxidoreductase
MTTTYKAVMLTGKGGLDKLEAVELPLVAPKAGELRVKIHATGAGFTDITMRTGYYPYRPPFPFVQGYELVGEVDALGEGVTGFRLGQRVAALTVHGGYAEYLVREAEHFVPVPDGLDDAEAVALILNYVTAYQMIHRSAKMEPGQTALVTGANGGVGTALLELLRLHGVKAIGAASKKHFELVRSLGAEPIESRAAPLEELVRGVHPGGVDVAFDGLGGKGTGECIRATRKGGMVVSYGFMGTLEGGNLAAARGFGALFLGAFLAGRRSSFYGITEIYRKDKAPLQEDLPRLFALLAAGKIAPKIAARLPLLAAAEAQRRLTAGGVVGKLVHLREVTA